MSLGDGWPCLHVFLGYLRLDSIWSACIPMLYPCAGDWRLEGDEGVPFLRTLQVSAPAMAALLLQGLAHRGVDPSWFKLRLKEAVADRQANVSGGA